MNAATAERVAVLNDRARLARAKIDLQAERDAEAAAARSDTLPTWARPLVDRDGEPTRFVWDPATGAVHDPEREGWRAPSEPLGNSTRNNFPRPTTEGGRDPYLSPAVSDGLKEGTLYRRRLRRVHQDHFARSKNQQKCGRIRCADTVSLHVDAEGAHWSGLVTCGSGTACPVCAARKAAEKGQEIAKAAAIWLGRAPGTKKRGDVLFITPTIRHRGGVGELGEAFDGMTSAWARIRGGSGWAKKRTGWRDRLGGCGKTIRGIDATHGQANGWHPHFHYLQFLGAAVDDELLAAYTEWLKARWAAAVVRELGPEYEPSWEVGVQVERVRSDENVGKYLAKMGLALELSGSAFKDGEGRPLPARQGRRAPMQILGDYANATDQRAHRARDGDLWREWSEGTSGRSLVHWSPGLRAEIFQQMELDLEEEQDSGKPWVLDVAPDVWGRVIHVPDATETVLDVAHRAHNREARKAEASGMDPRLAGLSVLAAAEEAATIALRTALDVAPEDLKTIYGGWDGVHESAQRLLELQNEEDQARHLSSFGVARQLQLVEWNAARRACRRSGTPEQAPREEYRAAFFSLLSERLDGVGKLILGRETA